MNIRNILTFLFIFIGVCAFSQQRRIALVIGNADYEHSGKLKNPVNDAELMAETLEELDFMVIKEFDADKDQMEKTIYEFSRKLKEYNVALFYYAGHGIQVNGTNYLLPTDAVLEDKIAAEFEAINVAKVVSQFEKYPDNTNIVILDACRNNPFKSFSRGGDAGFTAIPAPSGTIIAFATGEGATASDGYGENGLYTSKLVDEMKKPQRIEDVFIGTRVKVREASNNEQSPQEWSQLTGKFYFTTQGNNEVITQNLNQTESDTDNKTPGKKLALDRGKIAAGGYQAKVHIADFLSYGYSVNELLKSGIPASFMEGVEFQGGIIVSIDPEGKKGLVAAPRDLMGGAKLAWDEAKSSCEFMEVNGYNDWRLPSKAELELLYKNLKEKDYGNFEDDSYWSSSKSGYNNAWGVSFSSGRNYDFDKLGNHLVRPVRDFSLE